jgi:hypothetical protein
MAKMQEHQALQPENPSQPSSSGHQASEKDQSRLASETTSVGSALKAMLAGRELVMQRERQVVGSFGGHEAWLRAKARDLLPLFPAGISQAVFESDTLAFWEDAALRMRQCAACPSHGGACADGHLAFPEGEIIVPDPVKGIRSGFCEKWQLWLVRDQLIGANVPDYMSEPDVTLIPDVFLRALEEARRTRRPRWYFFTGGDPRRHRHLLVALMYELEKIHKKSMWFDWTPRIFSLLRAHVDDSSKPDPRDNLRTKNVLAVNIVAPKKWKDWFAEAMDESLISRTGKVTIIASAFDIKALADIMPFTSEMLESAVQVEFA